MESTQTSSSKFPDFRVARTYIDNAALLFIIFVMSLFLVAPALNYPLYGDDYGFLAWVAFDISKQPFLIFHKIYYTFYRPMMLLVMLLVYKLAGADPAPYHLLSFSVHAAITIALRSLLIFSAGKDGSRPLIRVCATLFAVYFFSHFRNTQTVLWASAIKELLAGGFALGAFYAVTKSRSFAALALAWLFCVLGILTLESLIMLPLIVCAVMFTMGWKESNLKFLLVRCLPFAMITVVYLGFYIYFSLQPLGAHSDQLFREPFSAVLANILVWQIKCIVPWNFELSTVRQVRYFFISHSALTFISIFIPLAAVTVRGRSIFRNAALLSFVFCFPFVMMFAPSFEGGRLFYSSLLFVTISLFFILLRLVKTFPSKWFAASLIAVLVAVIAFNCYWWNNTRSAMRRMAFFNINLYTKMLNHKIDQDPSKYKRLIMFGEPIMPDAELPSSLSLDRVWNVLVNVRTINEFQVVSYALKSKSGYQMAVNADFSYQPFRPTDIIISFDGKDIKFLSSPEADNLWLTLSKKNKIRP